MLFQMYKKKQGQIIRWANFLTWSFLFLYGFYQLYYFLSKWDWAIKFKWLRFEIPLVAIPVVIDPRFVIAIGCSVFFVWLFFYLTFQHERISEFLIDTESEMRKVSWPSLGQVVRSSIAVILIVLILGLYLYLVDGVLDKVFRYIF